MHAAVVGLRARRLDSCAVRRPRRYGGSRCAHARRYGGAGPLELVAPGPHRGPVGGHRPVCVPFCPEPSRDINFSLGSNLAQLSRHSALVQKLAGQLGTDAAVLAEYGGWDERTRTDHLREVLSRLGWRTVETGDVKAPEDFLAERAMEHDSPSLLLRLGCDHLRASRVVRPGVERFQRWVASARERAWVTTALRIAPLLSAERGDQLDGLLATEPDVGTCRLTWLRRGATSASAEAIKAELDKLAYLRSLRADGLDLTALPTARQRFLARWADIRQPGR